MISFVSVLLLEAIARVLYQAPSTERPQLLGARHTLPISLKTVLTVDLTLPCKRLEARAFISHAPVPATATHHHLSVWMGLPCLAHLSPDCSPTCRYLPALSYPNVCSVDSRVNRKYQIQHSLLTTLSCVKPGVREPLTYHFHNYESH